MNENTYNKLTEKLDKLIQKYSPDSERLVRSNDFTNLFITKDIDVSSIPKDKLPLVHVQLHTFFAEGNGKGLKPKDIVDIHNKIKNRLNSHQDFDKLDKQV